MQVVIPQKSQQRILIPNEPGEFVYTLEQDAQLTLLYEPSYFDTLNQAVVVELLGDNSSLELSGVLRDLSHDTALQLTIIHRGKNTDALAAIRGVLTQSVSARIGATIRVEPGATGTDTYYQADFLQLTDEGSVRSQPNLEIHESDIVNAGHGSSCGRIDENQVQYLEARGMNREQAKATLVDAFLGEMREKMGVVN